MHLITFIVAGGASYWDPRDRTRLIQLASITTSRMEAD